MNNQAAQTMPAKFRKKPVVIDALQYTGNNQLEVMTFVDGRVKVDGEGLIIPTLEGQHIASPGDWIIRGVKGEFYPCKPDIFAMTYEPAAALSQTAGVPALEKWERVSMEILAAGLRERGDDLSTDSASWLEKWLASAPAASGGERDWSGRIDEAWRKVMTENNLDPLDDDIWPITAALAYAQQAWRRGPLPPQKPQPPAGASVSERARELLATQYKAHSFHRLNAIGDAILAGDLLREGEISCALRALEQALTQQRGECNCGAAKVGEEDQTRHSADCATYTTPQPSADAVWELVARMRKRADELEENSLEADSIGREVMAAVIEGKSKILREVADELESLLARGAE